MITIHTISLSDCLLNPRVDLLECRGEFLHDLMSFLQIHVDLLHAYQILALPVYLLTQVLTFLCSIIIYCTPLGKHSIIIIKTYPTFQDSYFLWHIIILSIFLFHECLLYFLLSRELHVQFFYCFLALQQHLILRMLFYFSQLMMVSTLCPVKQQTK